jgi:hypothetical protein
MATTTTTMRHPPPPPPPTRKKINNVPPPPPPPRAEHALNYPRLPPPPPKRLYESTLSAPPSTSEQSFKVPKTITSSEHLQTRRSFGIQIRKPIILRDVNVFRKSKQVGQGTYG